jgi:hypothetical protein
MVSESISCETIITVLQQAYIKRKRPLDFCTVLSRGIKKKKDTAIRLVGRFSYHKISNNVLVFFNIKLWILAVRHELTEKGETKSEREREECPLYFSLTLPLVLALISGVYVA